MINFYIKGTKMLSIEQQRTIEDSVWVVNTALKRQGLANDEDMRQSAILYMCQCLQRYDPTKNVKWTTFAYKNIFLFIKRKHKREQKLQNCIIDDDFMDIEIIGEEEDLLENTQQNILLATIYKRCTPSEVKVLELKRQGYSFNEIGALLRCSVSKIHNQMQSIKEKARAIEI